MIVFKGKFIKPSLMSAAVTCALALAPSAGSQDMRSYAQKAVINNPEVTARFNALQAAINEIDVARGAYFPRVDLLANTGRERSESGVAGANLQSLSRTTVGLSLTQTLWDGLATRNEVRRLGHGSIVRFFEFIEASELIALESARAYYDVQRFRELVTLAEANYVVHKYTYDQIDQRFKSGVGRGVDLEQAAARLALADSNLVNETSNLHDVSARFQRIIGEAPIDKLPETPFPKADFPASREAAVRKALDRQPGITAAVENVRAVQAQLEVRRAAFQPKLEARLREARGNNLDGTSGRESNRVAELVLSWNLYNGGSDFARVRQFANALNNAKDLRDKACRDVRQTLTIAYNDAGKLIDQIKFLNLQVQAIEKARDAYRKQFDIGQRSLLDLLNSENELYQAKRALVNARFDREIAHARVHNAAGDLLPQMGLSRMQTEGVAADQWEAGEDAAERCPPEAVAQPVINKIALDAQAKAASAAAKPAPVPKVEPKAAVRKDTPEELVTVRLLGWATAWSSKAVESYLSFYGESFKPVSMSRQAWSEQRKRRLSAREPISVVISDVRIAAQGADQIETRFQQQYQSGKYSDQGEKTLTWRKTGEQWYIVSESGR